MKAQYAHKVAGVARRIKVAPMTAGNWDLKYLYTAVYPLIARAMWAGETDITVPSTRLTDELRKRLRAEGYHVAPTKESALTQLVSWGVHTIPSIDDQDERVVPSWEYERYLQTIDEHYEQQRSQYDMWS
jgi:hypothetical protein